MKYLEFEPLSFSLLAPSDKLSIFHKWLIIYNHQRFAILVIKSFKRVTEEGASSLEVELRLTKPWNWIFIPIVTFSPMFSLFEIHCAQSWEEGVWFSLRGCVLKSKQHDHCWNEIGNFILKTMPLAHPTIEDLLVSLLSKFITFDANEWRYSGTFNEFFVNTVHPFLLKAKLEVSKKVIPIGTKPWMDNMQINTGKHLS